jgi:hypothetical protein
MQHRKITETIKLNFSCVVVSPDLPYFGAKKKWRRFALPSDEFLSKDDFMFPSGKVNPWAQNTCNK